MALTRLPRKYFATVRGVVTSCSMVTEIFTDIYLTRAIKVDSFYFALYISLFFCVGLILLIWLLIQDKTRLLEENDWGIAV